MTVDYSSFHSNTMQKSNSLAPFAAFICSGKTISKPSAFLLYSIDEANYEIIDSQNIALISSRSYIGTVPFLLLYAFHRRHSTYSVECNTYTNNHNPLPAPFSSSRINWLLICTQSHFIDRGQPMRAQYTSPNWTALFVD